MNARRAIWFRAMVARDRDAVFATVPAQISGGLSAEPPSSSPSPFHRCRGGNRFPGVTAREEGLRILTSPRREASLFDCGGKLRFPAFFFGAQPLGVTNGVTAAQGRALGHDSGSVGER